MIELAMIGHFLATWLGLTNASGPIYSFWSGVFGDATIIAIPVVILRHKNCHAHRCWRLGRHPVEGTSYTCCRKHHPDGHASAEHIHKIFHARKAEAAGQDDTTG